MGASMYPMMHSVFLRFYVLGRAFATDVNGSYPVW